MFIYHTQFIIRSYIYKILRSKKLEPTNTSLSLNRRSVCIHFPVQESDTHSDGSQRGPYSSVLKRYREKKLIFFLFDVIFFCFKIHPGIFFVTTNAQFFLLVTSGKKKRFFSTLKNVFCKKMPDDGNKLFLVSSCLI